jgi:hypothetical protein
MVNILFLNLYLINHFYNLNTITIYNKMDKLREWIDEIVMQNNYNHACRDFLIQFSVFCLVSTRKEPSYMIGIESNEEIDVQEWYLQCAINNTEEEGIYDINVVYNDEMNVQLESHKYNYEPFIFDNINNTDYNITYHEYFVRASDLYPDFQPSNYLGIVCTRGGFSSWNYKDININGY